MKWREPNHELVEVIRRDIVLTFLPESDRNADDQEGGSFYHQIYSLLLNRRIASQMIYADTLRDVQSKDILNQVIPGILAKLGNLPFVLAEPLDIADYFIGKDCSLQLPLEVKPSLSIVMVALLVEKSIIS